ncbi:MAG TPA: hypothetical protein VIX89_19060 [Bryobacteraceae bacterium]
MRTSAVLFFSTLLIPTLPVIGQEKGGSADPGAYKVEFNIHDGNDAAKTGRRYIIMIEANERGIFRVGQKVPYATGSLQPGVGSAGVTPLVQYNYAEIGVNIECRISEINGRIRVKATLDLSTVVQHDKSNVQVPPMPIIGQLRVDVNALVNPGKPAIVASIDDPVTLRKFDVEATVTKIN